MKPLLNWLRAACTVTAATGISGVHSDPLVQPLPISAALRDKRNSILRRDIPGYFAPAPATGVQGVAAAVTELTEHLVHSQAERAARSAADKVKSPDDYYGPGAVIVLHRLCQVSSSTDLPSLFHDIANSTKKTERTVIEEHLRGIAADLGSIRATPVVGLGLARKLTSLQIAHHDLDDLSEGIHPFVTGALSQSDRSTLLRNIAAYDAVVSGAGARLEDLERLYAVDKVPMPQTFLQALHTFRSFRILLHAMLGNRHPFAQKFDSFVQAIGDVDKFLEAHFATPTACAQLVRWVQIRSSNWFTNQVSSLSPVTPPDFERIIEDVQNMKSIDVRLPNKYLTNNTPHTRTSTALPGVATPPMPLPLPPRPGPTTTRTRVTNTTYDSRFTRFKDLRLNLTAVRNKAKDAGHPVPKNNADTEFCLCYHVHGFCWDACGRLEDHRVHTAAESTKLEDWCKRCYRAEGPQT